MRRTATFLVSILLSSCASTTPILSSYGFKKDCIVVEDNPERFSALTIGSTRLHSTDSTIIPGSSEAQFLSRQLYETFTWIDCTNTLRKGLASSWESSDNNREWTFFIRPDAKFWNGAVINSEEIMSQLADLWQSNARIESFQAVSARKISFLLTEPDPNFPRLLADPRYSVYRSSPGIEWNIGSGPFRIESVRVSRSFGGSLSVTKIVTTFSDSNPRRPLSLVFHSSDGTDARDFITDGLDIVITVDPVANQYATESGKYSDYPLPWDRTYVVAWGFHSGASSRSRIPPELPNGLAEAFLNDIAPVEARYGTIPEWYPEFMSCSNNMRSTLGAPPGKNDAPVDHVRPTPLLRIVYDEEDPIARALAGRLSALSSSSPADSMAAVELGQRLPQWNDRDEMTPAIPVPPGVLNKRLAEGTDLYYILPLPRRVLDVCTIVARSYSIHGGNAVLNTKDYFNFLPLIDTRRHLFLSQTVSGLSLDWFGNLRFVP